MSKLRIALFANDFPNHSVYQLTNNIANTLDDLGHSVTIIGPDGYKATNNGEVINTGHLQQSVTQKEYYDYETRSCNRRDIVAKINSKNFDILHGLSYHGGSYTFKKRDPQLKVCHLYLSDYCDPRHPSPTPKIDRFNLIAESYYYKKYLKEKFDIKSRVVYSGIDTDLYKYDSNIHKTDNLLFVGNFQKRKRPDIAIKIAKELNMNLDIIGRVFANYDDYFEGLKRYIHNINEKGNEKENSRINIYEDVSQEFKIRKIQESKCLIFPSIFEPFGNVMIEAMACRTPVVALKDGGATNEIIKDKKTGFLCNNIEEMKEAIKDIDKIKPIDCRKHVEDYFSKEIMTKNYINLYKDIIDNREW